MTSQEFAYWLQGFFEISGDNVKTLDETQVLIIKNHLNLVFFHEIDPSYTKEPEKQETMQNLHDGLISPIKPQNPFNHSSTLVRC
jgi:hypothetical protein